MQQIVSEWIWLRFQTPKWPPKKSPKIKFRQIQLQKAIQNKNIWTKKPLWSPEIDQNKKVYIFFTTYGTFPVMQRSVTNFQWPTRAKKKEHIQKSKNKWTLLKLVCEEGLKNWQNNPKYPRKAGSGPAPAVRKTILRIKTLFKGET